MRKNVTLAFMVVCLVMGLISNASAFDGQRKGFILGFGVGPGLTPVDGDNKIVLINTNFKIGTGISEQFQLYWSAKSSWYKTTTVDTGTWGSQPESKSVTELFGVGGAGFSYFMLPTKPSVYVTGSIGYSAISYPFDSEKSDDSFMGLGISMGIGYEFSAHYSIECNLANGSLSSSGFSWPVWSVHVTFNALAY